MSRRASMRRDPDPRCRWASRLPNRPRVDIPRARTARRSPDSSAPRRRAAIGCAHRWAVLLCAATTRLVRFFGILWKWPFRRLLARDLLAPFVERR